MAGTSLKLVVDTTELAEAIRRSEFVAGLVEGRIVHYVLAEEPSKGEHRAALVVKVWNRDLSQGDNDRPPGFCNLMVFTDGPNDYINRTFSTAPGGDGFVSGDWMVWKPGVHYSETKEPGTWHWVEVGNEFMKEGEVR